MRKLLIAWSAVLGLSMTEAGAAERSVFQLQPPNYNDAASVGRHIAYSLILVNLINEFRDRGKLQNCYFEVATIDFPNWKLYGESKVSWQRCHDSISSLLIAGNFDQAEIDKAATRALPRLKAESRAAWYGRYPDRQELWYDILGSSGELALRELYPSDPVIAPLLRFDEWLLREKDVDDFERWLKAQFEPGDNVDRHRQMNPTFPIVARPEIDYEQGITIKLPRPGPREHKLIIVRCDTDRDWNCSRKMPRLCRLTKDEIIAGQQSIPQGVGLRAAALNCFGIGYIVNVPGFTAIDSQDPDVVVWAYGELLRRRQNQPESLIKDIIFVTIE